MKYLFTFSLIIFLFFSVSGEIFSQNPTWQLTVYSGGTVNFKILTLDHYENGGIIYDRWTRLRINYKDTTSAGDDAWKLGFKTTEANFNSSYSGSFPTENLSLQVANYVDSLQTNATIYEDRKKLSNNWTTLVESADEGTYWLELTYRLDSALINNPPGYYNTIIEYKVVENGDPYE